MFKSSGTLLSYGLCAATASRSDKMYYVRCCSLLVEEYFLICMLPATALDSPLNDYERSGIMRPQEFSMIKRREEVLGSMEHPY